MDLEKNKLFNTIIINHPITDLQDSMRMIHHKNLVFQMGFQQMIIIIKENFKVRIL